MAVVVSDPGCWLGPPKGTLASVFSNPFEANLEADAGKGAILAVLHVFSPTRRDEFKS